MHLSLQIMFILPLMSGHLFCKATILDGLYRGVPLYFPVNTINLTHRALNQNIPEYLVNIVAPDAIVLNSHDEQVFIFHWERF